ncbi:ABC transporter permease subunit [Thiospirochaeta perfilievii]|uniref:ABC transporter permease subunit n=1 Tax=Thiospirochaeta perfilievii TaxID=252967 RepID=A0A5C1QBJ3_9SPIO|nr:ABC transporter permease subunit [Thiospirochaeta perfilievii]QEN04901.1 ABC transporter permease subunit [Thiospirochaeta perfilievii]
MKKILFIVVAVFFVSVIPEIVSVRQGELLFDIKQPFILIANYFDVLRSGDIFSYVIRGNSRSLIEVFPRFFITSFLYLNISLFLGVFIGVLLGLLLSNYKTFKIRNTLSLIGFVPDFILIIILQILVIVLNNLIGFRLIKVATAGGSYAIILPLISMSLFPLIYMMNIVSGETFKIRGQSYVLYAKAKGLGDRYIFFKHILPGIFPLIIGEIPRLTGLIIANLFIVERLYNISGVTRLLFYVLGANGGLKYEIDFVQPHVVVNVLFGFVILYFLSYSLLSFFVKGVKKVVCND